MERRAVRTTGVKEQMIGTMSEKKSEIPTSCQLSPRTKRVAGSAWRTGAEPRRVINQFRRANYG